MRRHNQRIYRIVRGILNNDVEAEDVMQDAYVRSYQHLSSFEGRSTFVTWLTRIAMHEAFARVQRSKKHTSLESESEATFIVNPESSPERNVANMELHNALESAISSLPTKYRSVIIMRDVEEMTTAEAASVLEISEGGRRPRPLPAQPCPHQMLGPCGIALPLPPERRAQLAPLRLLPT